MFFRWNKLKTLKKITLMKNCGGLGCLWSSSNPYYYEGANPKQMKVWTIRGVIIMTPFTRSFFFGRKEEKLW